MHLPYRAASRDSHAHVDDQHQPLSVRVGLNELGLCEVVQVLDVLCRIVYGEVLVIISSDVFCKSCRKVLSPNTGDNRRAEGITKGDHDLEGPDSRCNISLGDFSSNGDLTCNRKHSLAKTDKHLRDYNQRCGGTRMTSWNLHAETDQVCHNTNPDKRLVGGKSFHGDTGQYSTDWISDVVSMLQQNCLSIGDIARNVKIGGIVLVADV